MKKNPTVSVLMPAYNAEHYLEEAVESILNQSFTDFEFIIIDDGSTDDTPEILRHYRDSRIVQLRHETNKGYVHALNHGLQIARGKFIARQDADDISLPDRLARQVETLTKQPGLVIVGSAYYTIDEEGKHLRVFYPPMNDTAIRWQMLFQNSFIHTSVLFRADTIRQHALRYDPQLVPSEDYGLWSEMLNHGEGFNVTIPLVKHRRHGKQISQLAASQQRANADRISQSSLKQLGFPVSPAGVRVLRDWQFKFPRPLSREEMVLYSDTLPIIKLFEKQQKCALETIHSIRQRWIKHTLTGIHISQWKDLWKSGLLETLVRADAVIALMTILTNPPKHFLSKTRRAFSL